MHVLALTSISMLYVAPRPTHAQDCASGSALSLPRCERAGPRRGPLGESSRFPDCSAEYTTKIFRHTPGPSGTTRDGTLHFGNGISWPITPFIGTIGTAPDREVTTSNDGSDDDTATIDIDCPAIHVEKSGPAATS